MTDITMVAGLSIVAAAVCVILRKYHSEYAMAVGICSGVIILLYLLTKLTPVSLMITDLLTKTGIPAEYGEILFKALGVGFIVQVAADACEDAGEKALGANIEIAGRITLLLLALPMMKSLLDLVIELMS